jgi:hypothetical protein
MAEGVLHSSIYGPDVRKPESHNLDFKKLIDAVADSDIYQLHLMAFERMYNFVINIEDLRAIETISAHSDESGVVYLIDSFGLRAHRPLGANLYLIPNLNIPASIERYRITIKFKPEGVAKAFAAKYGQILAQSTIHAPLHDQIVKFINPHVEFKIYYQISNMLYLHKEAAKFRPTFSDSWEVMIPAGESSFCINRTTLDYIEIKRFVFYFWDPSSNQIVEILREFNIVGNVRLTYDMNQLALIRHIYGHNFNAGVYVKPHVQANEISLDEPYDYHFDFLIVPQKKPILIYFSIETS